MAGNANQNKSGAPTAGLLHSGVTIEPFKEGGKRTPLSAGAMAPLVALFNALLAAKVARTVAQPNPDGISTASGRFVWSDSNLLLELVDAPGSAAVPAGTGNIVLCRVISESTEYLVCQPQIATADGVYADTSAPQINVAKPFNLRTNPGGGAMIYPVYTGKQLYAMQSPTGGTGVFVGGLDVGYQDQNVDSRSWAFNVPYKDVNCNPKNRIVVGGPETG